MRTTRARLGGLCVALAVSAVPGLGCKTGTVADEETPAPDEETLPPHEDTAPEGSPTDGGSSRTQTDGAVTRAAADLDAGGPVADTRVAADGPKKDTGIASGTPSPPCVTSALACEDFEGYATGGTPKPNWRLSVTAGSRANIDETHAFSGAKSMHFFHPEGAVYREGYIRKEGAPLLPVAGNNLFGRMMVWLAAIPGHVHWSNVQAKGRIPVVGQEAQYNFGGSIQYMANYARLSSSGLLDDCYTSSKSQIPVKRWVCMEWQFDGSRDELRFWIDGQPLADATVIKSGTGCVKRTSVDNGLWRAPIFTTLSLGWEHFIYSPTDKVGSTDLWLDDVVVDGTRIGCPQPTASTH
jgi:hypothetical protein